MISRPIPCTAISVIRSIFGRINEAPVPTMITSGFSANAGPRSVISRFSGSDATQLCNTSLAERIRLFVTHSSPIRTAPASQAEIRLASEVSLVNLMSDSCFGLGSIISSLANLRGFWCSDDER